jgi:hypothetical protein
VAPDKDKIAVVTPPDAPPDEPIKKEDPKVGQIDPPKPDLPKPDLPPVPTPPKTPGRTPVVAADNVVKLAGDLPALRVKSGDPNGEVLAKMCIDESGRVSQVKIVKSNPEIAADLQRALLGWRYKPYLKNGQATPVCFALPLRVVVRR